MTLEIAVHFATEKMPDLAEEWDKLIQDSRADIYFDRRWISTWWDHWGDNRQSCVLTIRENNRLVGLLPLAVGRVWFGPISVCLARLAGQIAYFPSISLPILPEYCPAVSELLTGNLEDLLSKINADVLCLQTMSSAGILAGELHKSLVNRKTHAACATEVLAAHALFRLDDNLEAYLKRLSRKRRAKIRKSLAEVSAKGIETKLLKGSAALDIFPKFADWHDQQWQPQGKNGHFGDWPQNRRFFAALCEVFSETGEARLYFQHDVVGRFLAAQFCFVSNKSCVAILAARDLESENANLDIGQYGQIERIARLIEEDISIIDSGQGEYDHKTSLGAEMFSVQSFLLCQQKPTAKIRLSVIRYWSRLLDLLYYRLWFVKLAPPLRKKFGAKTRPLWRHWIRTRL